MQAFQDFDAARIGDGGNTSSGVDIFCQDLEMFCVQHVHLGSDAALQRKRQTQRRLKWILALWDDPVRFEAIVKSNRYLRLCALTLSLSDCDERAWRRLKNEILAVREKEFFCGAAEAA
jgi:hypothetical protein